MFKCNYCGKSYKTERGFTNHKCEYKNRYESLINNDYFSIWLAFKTINRLVVNKDIEKEKRAFITSAQYKQFVEFSEWCKNIEMLNVVSYLEYLNKFNIPLKLWCTDKTYRAFLETYITNELNSIAIDRCEKYLSENGLNINTISQNRLYILMLSGKISKKYLNHVGFNYKTYLDCGQIKDLGVLA